ncbi:MAG: cytochrome C oxidase Cbb3, partial [Planctomycetes bacterium]|nr:cytochrome C oxidase Cbb3 [Planctomycetota bacterium]
MDTLSSLTTKRITYDDKVVRQFIFASVAWGLIGMLVGLICALQMAFHQLNFSEYTPFLVFSRLRPLHT